MTDSNCVLAHEEPRIALDGILLCGPHRRRIDADVTEIGLLVVDSQAIVQGGITGPPAETSQGGGHVKKRADPPAPGDVTLMALWDTRTTAIPVDVTRERNWNANSGRLEPNGGGELPAVLSIVASWVLLLADERPLTQALPSSVLAQLDLLKRHHEWIAAQGYIDDYVMEMRELRKALASAVRDHVTTRKGTCNLPTESGVCGGTLLQDNGSDVVRCVGCSARWVTDQELARLAVSLESA